MFFTSYNNGMSLCRKNRPLRYKTVFVSDCTGDRYMCNMIQNKASSIVTTTGVYGT